MLDTYETPVPGTLTVLVVRPDAVFVTRIGPAPMLALKPRFDAVTRTGPKLFDLRYLKPNSAPINMHTKDQFPR